MNHRLAQIFGAGRSLFVSDDDGAPGAVVLDHMRMIHRQILEPPRRIFDRIAARPHHVADQPIGFEHGRAWIVHEARLHVLP